MAGCKISVFEHNKGIFHLGQCPSCYSDKVLDESHVEDAEQILDDAHWKFVTEQGLSSIHTRTFPEAYRQQALIAMKEYAKSNPGEQEEAWKDVYQGWLRGKDHKSFFDYLKSKYHLIKK